MNLYKLFSASNMLVNVLFKLNTDYNNMNQFLYFYMQRFRCYKAVCVFTLHLSCGNFDSLNVLESSINIFVKNSAFQGCFIGSLTAPALFRKHMLRNDRILPTWSARLTTPWADSVPHAKNSWEGSYPVEFHGSSTFPSARLVTELKNLENFCFQL